ncbi:MAG TPA: hypothetical protein VKW08_07575 [Xanthobacteraceae bacterium]|nr:hypothetical protein [Xanthobacteraceae bacterium]
MHATGTSAVSKLLTACAFGAALVRNAAAADCAAEEATLSRDQAELPRLEVASPADRPITCITLETIIAFAARLKSHVAHCPASSYAPFASDWEKIRLDYATRFTRKRCKHSL